MSAHACPMFVHVRDRVRGSQKSRAHVRTHVQTYVFVRVFVRIMGHLLSPLSENVKVERYRAVCGTKFTIRKPSKWKPIVISTSIWTVCFAMCIPEWFILDEGTKMALKAS